MNDVRFLQRVIEALAPFALAAPGLAGDIIPLQYQDIDGEFYCVLIGDGESESQYLTTAHLMAAARVMGLIPEDKTA